MKKLILIFGLFILGLELYSQGNSCAQAIPICESAGGPGVTFSNNTNTTAPPGSSVTGPQYGCLGNQPNPSYLYLKTTAAGTMNFNISQVGLNGSSLDVDFIAWGPFLDYSTMCNNLTGDCSNIAPYSCNGNIEDCSFSPSATESMTLVSPGAGYYYLIMATNYAGLYNNVAGSITISQTGGPPTDCSITCPAVQTGDGILLANGNQIPSSISCGAAPFDIRASSNVVFGDPITPGVMISLLNNGNSSNNITLYENGSNTNCFGPSAPCTPLIINTDNDLQFSFMSPSAVNTFSLCETNTTQPNMSYTVTNLANNAIITTGTWTDDGNCQTISIPAGAVTGTSTFTASCGVCVTSTDYGYATFNPATAGPGTHTVTYTYNPGNGCAPYTFSKTITISTPSFSVAATPTAVCSGSSITLTATSPQTTLTFSNTADFNIPDANASGVTSNINVSGLTGTVGTQLVNVTLNINHTYDADLDISLRCPDGTVIVLSTDNGGAGDNYVNTVFTATATNVIGTAGNNAAPFTGNYASEQSFTGLSGCTMNGTWSLLVADDSGGNTGALLDWSITFNNTLSYSWAPATGLSATTGSVVTTNPTATTTYTVTGTDGSGCIATNTITLNVQSTPFITNVINTTSGCGTVIASLNPTSNVAGTTFSWTAVNVGGTLTGFTSTGTGNINQTITNNGTTQGTVVYYITPTAGACVGTPVNYTVTVNPLPSITASNNSPICAGQSINLSASSAGAVNYSWSGPNGFSSNAQNPVISNAIQSMSGNYTVTVTNSNNCTNANITNVSVNQAPLVNPITSFTICANNTISGINFSGSSGASFSWTNTNPLIGLPSSGTGSIAVFNSTNPNTTTITATITVTPLINNCSGSPALFTISVLPNPALTISGNTQICVGQSTTLTASGGTNYQWNNGTTSASINVNPTATTTYTVTSNNSNGCSSTQTVSVNVSPLPVPVITGNTNICSGETTTLTAIGGTSYLWSNGATTSSISVNPALTTTYSVSVSNAAGCSASNNITVNVNQYPIIVNQPEDTEGLLGRQAIFTITTTANSYQWQTDSGNGFQNISNGGQFNGANNDTLIVSSIIRRNNNQKFRCIVSLNGCSTISNYAIIEFVVPIGFNEFNTSNLVSIYPNPTINNITVELDASLLKDASIEIYDGIGKLILSEKIVTEKNNYKLNAYEDGIYTVRILSDNKQIIQRIIKNQ